MYVSPKCRQKQKSDTYARPPSGALLVNESSLIPAWMCNGFHHKVWYDIIYPFPNFKGLYSFWDRWIFNRIMNGESVYTQKMKINALVLFHVSHLHQDWRFKTRSFDVVRKTTVNHGHFHKNTRLWYAVRRPIHCDIWTTLITQNDTKDSVQ